MSARRMTSSKAYRDLIDFAEERGWTIAKTGKGHLRWTPPDGGPWVITPSSPSDRRGFLDDRARLRRHGLPRS